MRHAALALIALLTWVTTSVAADDVALVDGFRAVHDGAGSVRLEFGDRTPLEISLLWFGADGADARELTRDAGLETAPRGETSIARVAGTAASLESRVRHWGWFHVAPIAFLDARLQPIDGMELVGAAGLRLQTDGPWQRRTVTVQPHLAVGRAPARTVEVFETVVDLDAYDRRTIGLVRLDGRRAVMREDGERMLFEAGTEATWPLAIVVARSRGSLDHLVGQALVAYDDAGRASAPTWKIPPMCGRCRAPRLEELRLEVEMRERVLRIVAELRSGETIHPVAWPALRLEGIAMNLFHRRRENARTIYEIPVRSTAALEIAEAVDDGRIRAEVFMEAGGEGHRPDAVFVLGDPDLAERVRAYAPIDLEHDLPSYLSPRLVSNWPNPFRDETTIEVVVPSTLEQAFEVDEALRARIDPSTPPPFGETPMVRVKVYNVSGQLVDVLDEQVRDTGRFVVRWDGSDVQGRPVAAGAYYVNVEMGDWSVTRRVLRIRN